jgi:hypothetical protein
MGEMRNVYKIFVGKPQGRKSLARSDRRCKENIKIDLKETGYKFVDWIRLA